MHVVTRTVTAVRVERCPLCGCRDGTAQREVDFDRTWASLHAQFAVTMPAAVVERLTPQPTAVLRRCAACGLDWFDPSIPADAGFYTVLQGRGYYEPLRWDHVWALARIGPSEAVLDVGCGDGAFLAALQDAGHHGRLCGADHNESAVQAVRARGIEADTIETFADVLDGRRQAFDVVCGFQTIEHLASVDEFMTAASAALRPGGRIVVSVPNRDRMAFGGPDPLDLPPHHVSLWGPDQLRFLADRHGLEVRAIGVQRRRPKAVLTAARVAVRRIVMRREATARPAAAARETSSDAPGRSLLRTLRAVPRVTLGHSLAAELRLPSTDAPSLGVAR